MFVFKNFESIRLSLGTVTLISSPTQHIKSVSAFYSFGINYSLKVFFLRIVSIRDVVQLYVLTSSPFYLHKKFEKSIKNTNALEWQVWRYTFKWILKSNFNNQNKSNIDTSLPWWGLPNIWWQVGFDIINSNALEYFIWFVRVEPIEETISSRYYLTSSLSFDWVKEFHHQHANDDKLYNFSVFLMNSDAFKFQNKKSSCYQFRDLEILNSS